MNVLAPPARRPRRGLRAISTVLIVAGVLLLADAVATLLWQEPLSAVYASIQQDRLGDRLAELGRAPLEPVERRVLDRIEDPGAAAGLPRPGARPSGRARRPARPARDPGDRRLRRLRRRAPGPTELRSGPGHYRTTPLPGAGGTVGIAGHRTTYGAPFRGSTS